MSLGKLGTWGSGFVAFAYDGEWEEVYHTDTSPFVQDDNLGMAVAVDGNKIVVPLFLYWSTSFKNTRAVEG